MSTEIFIEGVPYGQWKVRGNVDAPAKWSQSVKQYTSVLPKIKGPCSIVALFILPPEKYP